MCLVRIRIMPCEGRAGPHVSISQNQTKGGSFLGCCATTIYRSYDPTYYCIELTQSGAYLEPYSIQPLSPAIFVLWTNSTNAPSCSPAFFQHCSSSCANDSMRNFITCFERYDGLPSSSPSFPFSFPFFLFRLFVMITHSTQGESNCSSLWTIVSSLAWCHLRSSYYTACTSLIVMKG